MARRHGQGRNVDARAGDSARAPAHAVVIGGSMAGLTTAMALTERFERVTVLDRDHLPDGSDHRRGVPQDRHLHLLLPSGSSALEELFPGILDQMAAEGAICGDADLIRLSLNGQRLARAATGHTAVFASRPLVEAHVRRRVRSHPAIRIEGGRTVRGLAAAPAGRRVTGTWVATPGEGSSGQVLPADLVVDCSGRASRTPTWLSELGYVAPQVDQLEVGVRYATQTLRLPSEALEGDRHVLVGPTAVRPRGGAMTHIGHDRWMVTLFAMGGETGPRDPVEFLRFAGGLPVPDIHDALRAGEPDGSMAHFRFPANLRHRYEQLSAFPEGLLVAGDAVCSFNPIYGQGMSVAALEATTLRRLIRDDAALDAHDWFRAIEPIVQDAWELAIGADLAVDGIEGRRPLKTRAANNYLRRLHAAAVDDPVLAQRFMRVAGLLDPPRALLRPATVARVMRSRRHVRGTDEPSIT